MHSVHADGLLDDCHLPSDGGWGSGTQIVKLAWWQEGCQPHSSASLDNNQERPSFYNLPVFSLTPSFSNTFNCL